MNKTNRILLLLLVVQALVITGMRLGGEETMTVKSVKILDAFDAAKVTRITIAGAPKEKESDPPQNSVALAKTGTGWGIATADDYPADKTKVEDFLKALGKLRSRNTVLTKSTFHKKLEVSSEKFQREITLIHDGKTVKLFVGSSPSFKNVHVRLDGQDEVYLVSDFSTSDAGDRAWSWVDRAYLNHPKKDVWSVRIENKNGTMSLEKNPANEEWLATGVTLPLDTVLVNNLVSKASSVNLESPMGKSEKPEYGLSSPLATITLVTGTSTITGTPPPTTDTTILKIGSKLEKENHYYVKSSRSDYVVTVAGWAIDPLVQKGPQDLIKKEETKKDDANNTEPGAAPTLGAPGKGKLPTKASPAQGASAKPGSSSKPSPKSPSP